MPTPHIVIAIALLFTTSSPIVSANNQEDADVDNKITTIIIENSSPCTPFPDCHDPDHIALLDILQIQEEKKTTAIAN